MRYSVFSENILPFLSVSSMGYGKEPEITKFGPGKRNEYIIHYVLSGEGFFNGNMVTAGKGFLITPESFEYYYPSKDSPWEFIWIISDDEKMKNLFPYYDADEESSIFDFEKSEDIIEVKNFLIKNKNRVITHGEMLELFLRYLRGVLNRERKHRLNQMPKIMWNLR